MADTTVDPNAPLEEVVETAEITEAVTTAAPVAPVTEAVVEDDDDDEDEEVFDKERALTKIRKANGEAKNLRAEVKRLRAVEARVKEDEDAKKSDLERAIARADAAEAKLKDKDLESATELIKARFDLPAKVFASLKGDTPDERMASAEEWAEDLGLADKTKPAKKAKAKVDAADLDGGTNPGSRAPDARTVKTVVDSLNLW